jgi:hypothetical protein
MKNAAFTGITVILVMFLVTCGFLLLPDDDEIIGWTDVEYVDSEDGAQITVYINGETPVPVTKKSRAMMAERAMSKNLAKMSYDFIEVVFISNFTSSGETTYARASWELGQSAGINGVKRDVDYEWLPGDGWEDDQALMFVGRKDGRTLLGIGRILQVDRLPKFTGFDADGYPDTPTPITRVLESSQSVTFWVEPIKTGLLIKGETQGGGTNDFEDRVSFDSFPGTTTEPTIRTLATRSTLGKSAYPLYPLPEPKRGGDGKPPNSWLSCEAEYTFGGAAITYKSHIVLNNTGLNVYDSIVFVEKRFPRYLQDGRYMQPKSVVDTLSEVALGDYSPGPPMATPDTGGATLNNVVPLIFTPIAPPGVGIFSFYIEIPVFMIRKTDMGDPEDEDRINVSKPTNGGPDAEIWKIRTGLGSEFYSLDDGISSGGCVLMGIGVTSLDWLQVEWEYVP